MVRKITIDSAAIMNKGFEVIATMWLCDVSLRKIDVFMIKKSNGQSQGIKNVTLGDIEDTIKESKKRAEQILNKKG